MRPDSSFSAIIYGELASKANSRRNAIGITNDGERYTRTIKSERALAWLRGASYQVQLRPPELLLQGKLAASMRIWYTTERQDLDESLVLDFLQDRAYGNDRQVRERHIYHGIDKREPRVDVLITAIDDIVPHDEFRERVRYANMLETSSERIKRKRATSTKILRI